MVKTLVTLPVDLGLESHGGSQPLVTHFREFNLLRHQAQAWYTHIHVSKTSDT